MATIEELNVKISADIKGLKRGVTEANKRVKSLGKTTKKSTKEIDRGLKGLGGRFQNLASSVAIVQGPLGGVAGRFSSIGALLKRVNVPLLVAIGGFAALSVVAIKSLKALIPFEQVMFRLGAVLKATGRDSETSIEQLDKFAIKLGAATLTSREAVLGATATLATFDKIKTDQFKTILTLAQDMAAVFKGDLATNTLLLARALSAPGEAFTILERKVGKFTEAEQKLLKELSDTGREAEAQEFILSKLSNITGAATKEASGLAGALDTLGENFRRAVIPIAKFTGFALIAGTSIKLLSKVFEGIAIAGEFFGSKIKKASDNIKEADDSIKKLGKTSISVFEETLTPATRRASEEISKNLSSAILESRNNLQAFGNFAENILNKIAADILRVSITEPLVKGILGVINPPKVPGFGTPGKALGGQIQANRPVMVGEKGPELLIPTTSGTVVPNNKVGTGNVTVMQNITIATGAEISLIDQKIANAAPIIANQAQVGLMQAIGDGSKAAQVVGRKF